MRSQKFPSAITRCLWGTASRRRLLSGTGCGPRKHLIDSGRCDLRRFKSFYSGVLCDMVKWLICRSDGSSVPSRLSRPHILVEMTGARFAECSLSFETSEPGSPSCFKTTGLEGRGVHSPLTGPFAPQAWQALQGRGRHRKPCVDLKPDQAFFGGTQPWVGDIMTSFPAIVAGISPSSELHPVGEVGSRPR